MKDFLFFAAVYGAAASLALLGFGVWWRAAGTWLDRKLFPSWWPPPVEINGKFEYITYEAPDPMAELKGGALRIFVHCPACLSFWIAALGSWRLYSPARAHFGCSPLVAIVIDGLGAAGIIWCVHVVLTRLGQYNL